MGHSHQTDVQVLAFAAFIAVSAYLEVVARTNGKSQPALLTGPILE